MDKPKRISVPGYECKIHTLQNYKILDMSQLQYKTSSDDLTLYHTIRSFNDPVDGTF